jgi:hypothetical protein
MTAETVLLPLVTGLVGGVVGASIKFTFDDVLSPFVGTRRELRKTVAQFTTPLVRSAVSLERRINILARNEHRRWFDDDEYFRLSTLYVFSEYFGWIRILERRFGFMPVAALPRGREFNRHLFGVFRALTSNAYLRDADVEQANASAVPRLMLTAVGEAITDPERECVIDFTVFATRYAEDAQMRSWFSALDGFLRMAHPDSPLAWERLLLTGAQLCTMIRFLDPKGRLARTPQPGYLALAAPDDGVVANAIDEMGYSEWRQYLPDPPQDPRPALLDA